MTQEKTNSGTWANWKKSNKQGYSIRFRDDSLIEKIFSST